MERADARQPARPRYGGDLVLIAAQSGRALAEAARRAGLRPVVADLFGDTDTRALAEHFRLLHGRFGRGLEGAGVLQALDELTQAADALPLGVVLGSGFEPVPEVVDAIASRYPLLGSGGAAIRAVKDPMAFAALLARLGVPHPPVSMGPVPDPQCWLAKRAGGSGGQHIGSARAGPPPAGSYWQRRVAGEARSVAFLANGRAMQMVGVTAQWTDPSRRAPFRYAGAVDPGACAPAVLAEMARALDAVVAATGLRGLCSADCLVDGAAWWLLEINPRPGATLDVLDRRPVPLLGLHIEACRGRLASAGTAPGAAAATILYAERRIGAVPPVTWPDWVLDRPHPGAAVPAGAPICTVRADAPTAREARALLAARAARVRRLLRGGHDHDPDEPPQRQRPGLAPHRPAGG